MVLLLRYLFLSLSMNLSLSSSTWSECNKLLNVNHTISSVE